MSSSRPSLGAVPLRPEPVDPQRVLKVFKRGRVEPRGVVWFGLRSFWGHLRHFIASAIATEDVDSRDWMWPDAPRELVARLARALGADPAADTLLEALDRDIIIDYVADTGDDSSVSEAVAKLVFAPYELPDPSQPAATQLIERGDILIFGGDTAYPVATGEEINDRVIAPFNRVLSAVDDGKQRVLLGIPGNHDWYDGLDGFARMFRRRTEEEGPDARLSLLPIARPQIEHAADWAKAFVQGGQIDKPKALVLQGYEAVQRASYFALPLAPDVELYAVDRQLKHMDFRQRHFFAQVRQRAFARSSLVLLPDPMFAFGLPSPTGVAMVDALELDVERERCLLVSGDLHHYERFQLGQSQHVVAGGGGAFLHPQAMRADAVVKADRAWPSVAQCLRLLRRVPWKVTRGSSGFIPHLVVLALHAPVMTALRMGDIAKAYVATAVAVAAFTLILALLGGIRRSQSKRAVWAWSAGFGAISGVLPIACAYAWPLAWGVPATWAFLAAILAVCTFAGVLLFGLFLTLMTRLGLEHTQAFTALDHPGFKHFLRLRVRVDAPLVDVWCIGLADPLGPFRPELVDCFSWDRRAR